MHTALLGLALALAQAAPRVAVRGTAIDAKGAPAANARVMLGAGARVARSDADAAGRFALETVAASEMERAWLEVRATDGACAFVADIPASEAPLEIGALVLRQAVDVKGRVVTLSGTPAAGARAFASLPGRVVASACDAGGRFTLEGLPAGLVTIGAEAPGYGDEVLPGVATSGPPREIEIRLRDEAPIDGVVVDDDDAPIAGARVLAARRDARRAFWRESAATDANGRFRILGVESGRRELDVRASRFGFVSRTIEGASFPVDGILRLTRGLAGTLRATAAIRSIDFESLTKHSDGWRRAAGAIGPGDREILAPDRWRISIPRGDVARFTVTGDDGGVGRSGDVTLDARAAAPTWSVALAPAPAESRPAAARVSGRLTIGGAPPGAPRTIVAIALESPRMAIVGSALAGADGRFALDVAAQGRVAIAPARAPFEWESATRSLGRELPRAERLRAAWVIDAKPGEPSTIDVDAPRDAPRSVVGIATVDGVPRPGLAVSLRGKDGPWGASGATDAEGRYALPIAGAGEARLSVRGDGLDLERALTVVEGQSRQVHFDLAPGAASGAIVDSAGRPLELLCALQPARDEAREQRWRAVMRWIASDAAGRFELPALEPGRYRVLIFDPARRFASVASEPFEMSSGERRALKPLVVPRAAPLRVTAREPDGSPATGRVTVRSAADGKPLAHLAQAWLWARPEGIVIHGLPPGRAVVALSGFAERTIALPATGQATEIEIVEKLGPAESRARDARERDEENRWDWGGAPPDLFTQEDAGGER